MMNAAKFYLDTHIPKAVAEQLRMRGVTVIRCEEIGLAEADDVEHLEYATSQNLIMISHDRDFWTLHGLWLNQGLRHAGIVLISRQFQGQVSKLFGELWLLYQMIDQGAGTLQDDIQNNLYEISR
jgi:uncharacterized protein with PIN domain